MKRITIVLLLILAAAPLWGQVTRGHGVPTVNTPNTSDNRFYIDVETGKLYIATQGSPIKWVDSSTMAGGGGAWGSVTGTLTDQTDLLDALNLKLNAADLDATLIVSKFSGTGDYLKRDGSTGTPTGGGLEALSEDADSVNSTKGIEAPSVTTTGSAAFVQIPDGGTAGANKFTSAAGAVKWGDFPVSLVVASGTVALPTSSIAAGQCATAVSLDDSDIAATDTIQWTPNADISGVTGYTPSGTLRIYPYPASGKAYFKVCNGHATDAVTPGAVTLNVRVTR